MSYTSIFSAAAYMFCNVFLVVIYICCDGLVSKLEYIVLVFLSYAPRSQYCRIHVTICIVILSRVISPRILAARMTIHVPSSLFSISPSISWVQTPGEHIRTLSLLQAILIRAGINYNPQHQCTIRLPRHELAKDIQKAPTCHSRTHLPWHLKLHGTWSMLRRPGQVGYTGYGVQSNTHDTTAAVMTNCHET